MFAQRYFCRLSFIVISFQSDAAFTYTISILVIGGTLVVVGACGACTRASKLHRLRFVFSGSVCALIVMVLIAVLMLIWQWMDVSFLLERCRSSYSVLHIWPCACYFPRLQLLVSILTPCAFSSVLYIHMMIL